MCFSPDKFKSMDSVEKTTSHWFGHEEAWRKRGEIARLILESSNACIFEESALPSVTDNLETEEEEKKKPLAFSKVPQEMKVTELQEALVGRGLSKSGRKADLVARLQSSLKAEGEGLPPKSSQNVSPKRKLMLKMFPNKRTKF